LSHTWALREEIRKLELDMLGPVEVGPKAVLVPKAGLALKAVEVVFSLHVDLQGNQGVVGFLAFWTLVAGNCCK
jgi:hypothetical protein